MKNEHICFRPNVFLAVQQRPPSLTVEESYMVPVKPILEELALKGDGQGHYLRVSGTKSRQNHLKHKIHIDPYHINITCKPVK